MQLVSTVTVGAGGAASISFTGIPQITGADLLLVVSGRASGDRDLFIQLNGDTGANYSRRYLRGSGSAVISSSSTGSTRIEIDNGLVQGTANTFASAQIYFPNYTSSVAKSISIDNVTENNGTEAYQLIMASAWSGTSAITSMTVFPPSATFLEHSTASLYTITRA